MNRFTRTRSFWDVVGKCRRDYLTQDRLQSLLSWVGREGVVWGSYSNVVEIGSLDGLGRIFLRVFLLSVSLTFTDGSLSI